MILGQSKHSQSRFKDKWKLEQVEGNRPLFGSNFTVIKRREMEANEIKMRCFKGQETMQHGYAQGNSVKKE